MKPVRFHLLLTNFVQQLYQLNNYASHPHSNATRLYLGVHTINTIRRYRILTKASRPPIRRVLVARRCIVVMVIFILWQRGGTLIPKYNFNACRN
jgi:hypothetical protein